MASDVSSTRLYLGNLPRSVTKKDVEDHFKKHGAGEITEVKLMSGFGFIEYKDAMDAMDVVPVFVPDVRTDGTDFMGERLTVQFARGPRHRDAFTNSDRSIPRPRRTPHRMLITGLQPDTSWQDLKDFARQSGLDVVYSEVGREHNGKEGKGFVEFETAADLRAAVEKLDRMEFKGSNVSCVADSVPVSVIAPAPPLYVVAPRLLQPTMIVAPGFTLLLAATNIVNALPAVTTTILEIDIALLHVSVGPLMTTLLRIEGIQMTYTIGHPDDMRKHIL
ncbi:hypothetical protein GP486_005257 [Trichoglossum hirsutum]|uniref:RRM domain-containing protein n=1 Tax=Trichoglossum hirsutum TaxID=265104 RepID=A0A9P8L9G2_9PEZI|nr:hypothetical protein GP486_005257 [Trichoglossum hirsutum]